MKATVYKSLAAIVVAMTCMFASASAQDNPLDPAKPKSQVLVGPVIGINRNFHSGGFRVIPAPDCPVFESGSGWGFLAGLTAEFQLGESWSLIPRITYDSRPGEFHQTLDKVPVLINSDDQSGTVTTTDETVSTTSTITYSLLNAEVMYKQEFWQIGKGVRVAAEAGPVFGYVMGGKNRQVQDLEQPENARFINQANYPTDNNGRTIIFFDGDIPGRNSIRFSLKAGLQAEVGLFNNAWIMCPGIYYDYGLTKVTNTENWNLNSILFQVDFRRAF
jgi:hypothetical protein